MESHQVHTHVTEKKFKHYLFEFFMLFFAVTLGFFVENIREHLVEKTREKEYIISMISDMRNDIKQLDSLNSKRQVKQQMIDSILFILDSPDPNKYNNELYYFIRWMPRPLRIITNDGTMQQLKNAGNLRLIRDANAVDAMMEYDQLVRFQQNVEEREETLIQQFYPAMKRLFDPRVFEKMVVGMRIDRPQQASQLLHTDKESLDELYSHIHFLKNVNSYSIEYGKQRRKLAQHVLDVLQKEYNLN